MLNGIWLALMLGSVLCAAFTGRMGAVGRDALQGAIDAVTLVIKLLGPMALFLGLIRVARDGGLLYLIARALRRPMRFMNAPSAEWLWIDPGLDRIPQV